MEEIGQNALAVLGVVAGVGILLVVGVVVFKIVRSVTRACLAMVLLGVVIALAVGAVLLLQGAR